MTLLIKALRVIGLKSNQQVLVQEGNYVTENDGCSIISTLFKILLAITLHLYFLHILVSPLLYCINNENYDILYYESSIWIKYALTLLVYDYFLIKKDSLYSLWNTIKTNSTEKLSLKNENLLFLLVICHFAFHITRDLYFIKEIDQKFVANFTSEKLYSLKDFNDNLTLVQLLYALDVLVKGAVCSLIKPLLYLFVTVSARRFCQNIYSFKGRLNKYFSEDDQMAKVLTEHTAILRLNENIGEHLGFFYVVWVGEWMITFFMDSPRIVQMYCNEENSYVIFRTFTTCVLDIVFSLYVSFTLSDIASIREELICNAQVAISTRTTNSTPQIKCAFIMEKFDTGKIGFLAFKCILITKSFILNLYFFSSTFVIFSVQEFLAKRQKSVNGTIIDTNNGTSAS